jgi:hypothetical protein
MMTDQEARGLILTRIYELRNSPPHRILDELKKLGFDDVVLSRHLVGLKDEHYIDGDFHWPSTTSRRYIDAAMITITPKGSRAIENPESENPARQVVMGHNITIHSSQNFQIGDHNTQSTTIEIDKLNVAIDNSQATIAEKEKAKSAIRTLLESRLAVAILASFFTGVPISAE